MLPLAARLWLSSHPPSVAGVVIITLDTTRADRLPPYGYLDVPMPHLDRLAREGVVFDRASSVAPLTLPAHSSLFTGLFPPRHGVRDNADEPLADAHTTLAEILHRNGFRTGAFVGSVVLDPDRGLAQGFEHYSGVVPENRRTPEARQRRADEVVTDALQWLDGIGPSRFFLWTHLYDPHKPYTPPEPYASWPDPYVGEIAFADSQIGRLIDALERRNLLDRIIVLVAGDHGESLGEHGEPDHGLLLYEGVLRVPLIIRAPAVPAGRIDQVVRQVDVVPTVLDLLGLPVPPVDGISLLNVMQGSLPVGPVEAYAESLYPRRFGRSPLRAVRDGRYKLIDGPQPELYDLDRDPFEERNLYGERRSLAGALTRRVKALAGTAPSEPDEKDLPAPVPADLRERLAALGYIASATENSNER
jgi:arylsulfatase A-like enzyme